MQQLERGEIAAATRDVGRDAVRWIGARLEQHLRERQVADRTHRGPQRRSRELRMPVPVVLGIRIRAERAQPARDRDQAIQPGGDALVHARVAGVEQRLPVLRSARLASQARDAARRRASTVAASPSNNAV